MKKNNYLVSIIIRAKNEEKWISACLRSVFNQSNKNIEVIIVDNYSTDNTIKIINKFNIKKIIKIKNYLPGKALNKGISNSSGDIIVCLSGHCIVKNSKWLGKLTAPLKNKNIGGVYGRQEPLSFSSPYDKRDLFITFGLDRKIQKKDSFFHNANSSFRKNIWIKNKFDEKTTNVEDRIWAKQILKKNYKIIYEPEASVYHYHGIHQNLDKDRAHNVVKIIEDIELKYKSNLNKPLNNLNIVCIIPTKGDPIKFQDKYLINYTINNAINSKYVNEVFVMTDSLEMKKIAKKNGAKVPFIRPKELSSDHIDIANVLKFSLKKIIKLNYKIDLVVIMEETYPIRPKKIIEKMLISLKSNNNNSIVAIHKEFRKIWLEKNNYIEEFNERMPTMFTESLGLISLFGLCCITTPELIFETSILGNNNGYYEIKDPLNSIQVRDKKIFKKIMPMLVDFNSKI